MLSYELPQPPRSEKIGIRLGEQADSWITPWHGVVMLSDSGYKLLKRSEAEALGGQPVPADDPKYFRRG